MLPFNGFALRQVLFRTVHQFGTGHLNALSRQPLYIFLMLPHMIALLHIYQIHKLNLIDISPAEVPSYQPLCNMKALSYCFALHRFHFHKVCPINI